MHGFTPRELAHVKTTMGCGAAEALREVDFAVRKRLEVFEQNDPQPRPVAKYQPSVAFFDFGD